jgi:hypothetical protein
MELMTLAQRTVEVGLDPNSGNMRGYQTVMNGEDERQITMGDTYVVLLECVLEIGTPGGERKGCYTGCNAQTCRRLWLLDVCKSTYESERQWVLM